MLRALRFGSTLGRRQPFASIASNRVSYADDGNIESLERELRRCLGDDHLVTTNESTCRQKGADESYHRAGNPWMVVTPTDVEQVSAILRLCNARRVPVIPTGTCTGLEGGIVAPYGGVAVDLMRLDQVLSVNAEDFDCTVQAAVTRKALNFYLRDTGLWFPIDPGADASLGGMCATGASGTNAVRFGTMHHNVMNLQVVLPSGEIIHTRGKGRRAKKSSAGYNLTNLFIGSEGTLGIITAATLRLYGKPEAIVSAVCSFTTEKNAVDAVVLTLQSCIPITRVEFLDDTQMKACNEYSHMDYPVAPTLFLEFHGSPREVQANAEAVREICKSLGGSEFKWANEEAERKRLWQARHDAYYAALALKPTAKAYSTDVCVPISKLAQSIVDCKRDLLASGLFGTIVGHVGDGNFHCFLLIDPSDEDEMARLRQLSDRLVKRALAVGGTCTGEHGVGVGKKHFLEDELGSGTLDVMRLVKSALDPNGIMNPGKVIPNKQ